MKKITLIATALLFAVASQAQITLTQSTDPVNVTESGVACWSSPAGNPPGDGSYSANGFLRAYDLADFGVTGDFELSSVEYGQGSADEGKQIFLTVYTADNMDLSIATLTEIASTTHTSTAADDLTLVSEPITGTVPAGSIVVFEVFGADSAGNPGETYFPGRNTAGENDLSYLRAADCGILVPTPVGTVATAEQYVMNVIGDEVLGVNDNLSDVVSIFPNPTSDILNVRIPSGIQVKSAGLFDVLGKETGLRLVNGTINTSGLARGVYILNIQTDRGSLTEKIVKQ